MKSVSVVEVYTTNFSCTLMSIEEMYCNEFLKQKLYILLFLEGYASAYFKLINF